MRKKLSHSLNVVNIVNEEESATLSKCKLSFDLWNRSFNGGTLVRSVVFYGAIKEQKLLMGNHERSVVFYIFILFY